MKSDRVETICRTLRRRTTDELLLIWESNDRETWTPDAFEAVRRILEERGVPLPEQPSPDECRARRGTWSEWRDGPAGALARLELRRVWGRRRLWAVLVALMSVLFIEGVLLAYLQLHPNLWQPFGTPSHLSLHRTLRLLFLGYFDPNLYIDFPMAPQRWREWALLALTMLPGAVSLFLLPAFAALTVAPDRETGGVQELVAAGMAPEEILAGKGLGRLGPVLLLSTGVWILVRVLAFSLRIEDCWGHVLWMPVEVLLRGALLLGVSALCRNRASALFACYSVQFGLHPLLPTTWYPYWPLCGYFWGMPMDPGLLHKGIRYLPEAILAAATLRAALLSLRHPRVRLP